MAQNGEKWQEIIRKGGGMSDLTERLKDIPLWKSTRAEREKAVRERAKIEGGEDGRKNRTVGSVPGGNG